jgi:hypothetical protein
MDAGLVVVLAVLGVFLLIPLGLAWVSTSPRRWSRIEGVLGRDLPTGHDRVPHWMPWALIGGGVLYLAGAILLRRDRDAPGSLPLWVLTGIGYIALGMAHLIVRRRQERRSASVQSQVEDRAEPGGPAAGG